jgi:hypothetical protein
MPKPETALYGITCRPADNQQPGWTQHVLAPTPGAALDRALSIQPINHGDALIVVWLPLDRELEQQGQAN